VKNFKSQISNLKLGKETIKKEQGNSTITETKPQRRKFLAKLGKIVLYIFLSIIILTLLGIGILIIKSPSTASALYGFVAPQASRIALDDGKVNILLMGKSGGFRDGSDLTDTMMIVSVSLGKGGIKSVSIPRDVWVPDIMAKINSTYFWGKNGSAYFTLQDTGGGITFAKRIVGKIVGKPIHYGVVLDFSAFKDIVDAVGGISVDVERPFVDNFYPIAGRENDTCSGDRTYACRYETVIFDSGVQFMNGEKALKFVRSRHAEGDEGTDIAREARQQKVIEAIKNKILQPKTFLSVKKVSSLVSIAEKYIETDIDFPTAGTLGRYALDNVNNVTQVAFPQELLVVPPTSAIYANLYVFIPKAGNGQWEEIQNWYSSLLDN
jgi:LCP family protein required for cell wall assembly